MKKILFAALIVLLLTAVCVVGLLPALSDSTEGVVTADQMNVAGASINANDIKAAIADETVEVAPEGTTAVDSPEAWAAMTSGGTYQLTADITVTASLGTDAAPFSVTIYGNGHTVTTSAPLFAVAGELTVYDMTLAGTVTGNGALADIANTLVAVGVANTANVSGAGTAGGLVGTVNTVTLDTCINLGSVTGANVAGGLVGSVTNSASISMSANGDGTNGAVSATYTVGGIVGQMQSVTAIDAETPVICNCLNYVVLTVTATDAESAAGGVVGLLDQSNAEIANCTNMGAVTGAARRGGGTCYNGFGGIVGRLQGDAAKADINYCMNAATITIKDLAGGADHNGAGGIVGLDMCADTTVEGCINVGNISNGGTELNAGCAGIIGKVQNCENCAIKRLTVKACSNSGNVAARRSGGIIGIAEDNFIGIALVEDCTNRGVITSTANYAAGIAARLEPQVAPTPEVPYPVTFKNCVNTGAVSTGGGNCAGGIYGYATQKVAPLYFEGCLNTGDVTNMAAGGICANAQAAVFVDCRNAGVITSSNSKNAGGIAGHLPQYGTFENCTNDGEINSANYAGGIAGNIETVEATKTTFKNCVNNANVTGAMQSAGIAGRIVTYGTDMTDCVNNGNITVSESTSASHAAGMVAELDGDHTMLRCINNGDIVCNGGMDAGGLVARGWTSDGAWSCEGTYTECVNNGNVISDKRIAGGLCGYIDDDLTFTDCENTGNVKGATMVGGLAGRTRVGAITVTSCVNTGDVIGAAEAGGIMGYSVGNATVTKCVNTGYVEGGKYVGGIAGSNYSDATFTNCVNEGDISAAGTHVGGISGWNGGNSTFTKCVNTGAVKGPETVGGMMGGTKYITTVTSCINLGYIEGGKQVGGMAGSVGHKDSNGSKFIGCVSQGDVYNTGVNATDKSHCVAGIVGYCYNKAYFYYNTITGNISGNYTVEQSELVNKCAASAIAGYQNGCDSEYVFNYFTGTLDAGPAGLEVLIKACPGHGLCDNNHWDDNSTYYDEDSAWGKMYTKWNYTVNDYPFFTEKCKSTGTVVLYDPNDLTNHSDFMAYEGWLVTMEQVQNGTLANTLNTVTDKKVSGYEDGAFVQYTFCDQISMPIYNGTRDLYAQWCGAEHEYDQLMKDETGHWYKCSCGEVAPEGVSEHAYTEYKDSENHWSVCSDCGYTTAKTAHTLLDDRDATYHWQYCEDCHKIVNKAEHAYTEAEQVTADTHIFKCTCGLVNEGRGEVPHQYKYDVTDEGHRLQCVCGAVQTEDYTAHTPKDSTIYHDSTLAYHWQLCVCGYKLTEEHYTEDLDAAPDCSHKLTCDVCGEAFGDYAPENHVQKIIWQTNETKHYGRYPCCGVEVGKPDAWGAHEWASKIVDEQEVVYCVVCEKVCEHTGGTATCLTRARCDYCLYYYGSVDKTNHEENNCTITWYLTVELNAKFRTHHKGIRTCGTLVDEAEHTFNENGVCTVCSFDCVATGCEGDGTENCQKLAKCKYCKLECGVIGNHDIDDTKWLADDENDQHYHACTIENCEYRADVTSCTGTESTATCMTLAVCPDCQQSYGDYGPCNPDTDTYLRDPDSAEGAEKHYNPCKNEGCNEKCNITACDGGTANCVEKAICSLCKDAYGSTNPNYHKNGGDTGETDVVPAEGEEATHHYTAYTCCGVVVDNTTEAHTFGDDNVCDFCDYECQHGTYRYEKTYVETDDSWHNKICTICEQIVATEQHRKDYENTNDSAATCQQPAFCGLCGSSYGEIDEDAHNFSSVWTQIDDFVDPDAVGSMGSILPSKPVHYHECLNEGCNVKGDFGDCNGQETQTCAAPAKCHICEGEYGTVSDECTGVDWNKWDTETVENVQYHFHLCAHCGEKHNYEACAIGENGTQATCTSKATCGACGAEFGAVNESAHTTTAQTWKVDNANDQHYKVWDCCNNEVADSRGAHTYTNTEKPSECKCGHQCQHGEWTYTDKLDGNHTKSCDVCLYEVDEAHIFATDWSFDEVNFKHYHACTATGCTARDSEGDCSADVVATCQTAAKCSVCGKAYGDPVADAHTLGDYIQENDQHYKECTIEGCNYTTTPEACDGTGADCQTKATCATCQMAYGQPDPNVHANTTNYTYTPIDGGVQHRCYYVCCPTVEVAGSPMDHNFNGDPVCDDCGYTCTHENMYGGWTKDDDNTHSQTCQNCGYQNKVAHNFDTSAWFNQDAAGHYYKCTQEGCDATTEVIAHVYDRYVFPDETKHQLVCECGHDDPDSETEEHDFDVYEYDENQHWIVCDCKKTTESTAHAFELSGDKNGHQQKCVCGVTTGPVIEHIFDSETGICTDAECGYGCTHDQLTYVASETLATVHDAFCDVCGKKVISEGVHTFDFQNPNYVSDGHYHWIACPCGAKFDAENGAMEHSTGAVGDVAATCKTPAYCSVCKQHYGETDRYNHATPNTYEYHTDPADLGRHIKTYDCCGMEIASEVHTFENGVCKFCDGDCIHTGGRANCQNKAICTTCGQPYGNVSADHAYTNACDTDCNVCGTTRETAHKFGEWVETTAPTTTAKGKETRTCSVCGVTETYDINMLPVEEEKLSTGVIVAIAAGAVVGAGAIMGVIVWIAKSRAAARLVASQQKPWRTKQGKKKKWKKRK